MARSEILATLIATCEPILHRRDLELVDLTLGREAGRRLLRVTVDRGDRPVSLDEISEISEEISRALDMEDPIEERYVLEVASPGIERPLVRPSDFQRFAGRRARARTADPIEGRRNFTGVIASAGDESFVLRTDDGVVEIPYVAVANARLVVDWDRELKGLGREAALGMPPRAAPATGTGTARAARATRRAAPGAGRRRR